MSKKICTGCDENNVVNDRANWNKELGRNDHPPCEFMPDFKDIVTLRIKKKKFKNRYIYFFGAESCKMLEKDNKECNNISPDKAYDNFENSGISRFNNKGICQIYLSKPVKYTVKENLDEKKTYESHIHYKVSEKINNEYKWSNKNYTIRINEKMNIIY